MNCTHKALVVTTIARPGRVLKALADGCRKHHWDFIVVGDVFSPKNFALAGCDYYDLQRQLSTGLSTAKNCPRRHYARKNIGYLIAMSKGARLIVETDDDNLPGRDFWQERQKDMKIRTPERKGWVNVYSYFTDRNIWPRGLPLTHIHSRMAARGLGAVRPARCLIQQGLADGNPDVDAIFRLVHEASPVKFFSGRQVALGRDTWSPFNSQNTAWWQEAFPLLYLPAFCSFRMTDIWRSLIAQKIAWANGWSVLFHGPTVRQVRNSHDLMKDFTDEIPGYLQTDSIQRILAPIKIKAGTRHIPAGMKRLYGQLIKSNILDPREMGLLESWLKDIDRLCAPNA